MYRISVPVVLNDHFCKEEVYEELKRCHASRVFLALTVPYAKEAQLQLVARLKECIDFFRANGLETGVWFWTYVREGEGFAESGMTLLTKWNGEVYPNMYCPADRTYVDFLMDWIGLVAEQHPDVIMFDDDYGHTFFANGVGCFCKHHRALYREALGEDLLPEELYKKAYAGGKNHYRTATMAVRGKVLEEFALRARREVDRVNPTIRLAVCSVMSLWDTDGVDSVRIAKRLAGTTKPILRLIGAPYWAVNKNWGNRLQHTVEIERMEASWCRESDIEFMTEGDVYPRPRYQCPASYLECFDTMLRSAGVGDGILKYMLDYTSSTRMERGYLDRHKKHEPIYSGIDDFFRGECVGVRVYESMKKLEEADLSGISAPDTFVKNMFFPRAARMLSDLSIPTTYSGEGVTGIAFGENARHLPREAFRKGLILDISAARILMAQGIDVGVKEFGAKIRAGRFCFSQQEEFYSGYGQEVQTLCPKAGAQVVLTAEENGIAYPNALRYENASGEKFLVLGFDAYMSGEIYYRSYGMQKLLTDSIPWLSGESLPVICTGNPDCYVLCKKDAEGMSVGIWNLFADEMTGQEVLLDASYSSVEWLAGKGELRGNRLRLEEIPPFSFAMFRVKC